MNRGQARLFTTTEQVITVEAPVNMANKILLAVLAFIVYKLMRRFSNARRNYVIAKTTGFPVFYAPVFITEMWWMILYPFIVPLFNLLPPSLKDPWLPLMQRWKLWKAGYKPYQEAGSDTLVFATPTGNLLSTCDPVVINQIWTQPKKLQHNMDVMKVFNIWGHNIATTEGDEWRPHRRTVNAGFTPAIHARVWEDASDQTQSLIDHWCRNGSIIKVVKIWTSKLALHVISGTFFHKTMHWEQDEVEETPNGREMGFEEALNTVTRRIRFIFLFNKKLLSKLPFAATKESYTAFVEWTNYMKELRQTVLDRLDEASTNPNKSLLESIVVAGTSAENKNDLPEDHALGNIFFTLLAGHESTGNTLAFTLLLLAIYPEWQRRIQGQLDKQFQDRPRHAWGYQQDYGTLRAGEIWAVIRESLRVHNTVQMIWRKVVESTTLLDSDGVLHPVPQNTICMINFSANNRNPTRWTPQPITRERRNDLHDAPALDFNPERWLSNPELHNNKKHNVPNFFPFGQGPRSCPGERFASVEMVAVLVTIFKNYSLELVIDETTLRECGGDATKAWETTRDNAMRTLIDDVQANINVELWKELPIRVVERAA